MTPGLLLIGRLTGEAPVRAEPKVFRQFQHWSERRFVCAPEFVQIEQVLFVAESQFSQIRLYILIPCSGAGVLAGNSESLMLKTDKMIKVSVIRQIVRLRRVHFV